MPFSATDIILQRRRVDRLLIILSLFGVVLVGRLFYLQIVRSSHYSQQAANEHTRKYEIPAPRGQLFVEDGDGTTSPVALNQTLNLIWADPRLVTDKAATAKKIASALGGSAADYQNRLEQGIEYAVLDQRVADGPANTLKALNLRGVGITPETYRTYPEGSLMAQVLGFVNLNGIGQYGIEQYLNKSLSGTPGRLAAKTDTNGLPIATADNIQQEPVDGTSYVLTIDRNIQAMVETQLAAQVKAVNAKSGSAIVLDPATGDVRAMATYPTFDPNNYGSVSDYSVFTNQVTAGAFEPGSGMKVFTMAAGIDTGKVTPNTTYNDPGCLEIDTHAVCDAAGDKPGPNKTMTVVLRDSLNTGVMFVLRQLGGNANAFTLAGKQLLYSYFTNHFGFGKITGIEQAGESAGIVNKPSNDAGNDVNYANMTFGQGVSVTMLQMASAMAAIANGGKLYQPQLVAGVMESDGTIDPTVPKIVHSHIISETTASEMSAMLQVVVEHGSGYLTDTIGQNKHYLIAGKTGTAQIPSPSGGYITGANIGSFLGYAPADKPKFVVMVRINEPGVSGYAESTTVPVFAQICNWLFQYYDIAPER